MDYTEITPEELEAMKAERAQQEAERAEAIKGMTPSELVEMVEDVTESTDVVLEGYFTYANTISESGGVAAAAMIRLRNAIDTALVWLKAHHQLDESESDSSTKIESESDDSEEL